MAHPPRNWFGGDRLNSRTARSVAVALVAVALAFTWQALTVHFNYGGNWTALFCTGERLRVPPQLAWEGIYRFPASDGYDGQFYHYMAHDPFLQKGFVDYMDDARLRYRRILVPAAAYLLAAGRDRYVDTALVGVIWLSVFLGAYWLSRYAVLSGRRAAWGLGFLLVPAVIVSIDRTVVDITLAAITVGFVLHASRGGGWKPYLLLACACLTRETGMLLPASYGLYLLWKRLPLKACLFATSALPAVAWAWSLGGRTRGDLLSWMAAQPASTYMRLRALRMATYNLPGLLDRTLRALDYLVLAGIVLAMILAIRSVLKSSRDHVAFAGLAFALFMVLTMMAARMEDPFTYARLASPLLLLVAIDGIGGGWRFGWAPLALVALRTAAQLTPQALGVLRGLLGK